MSGFTCRRRLVAAALTLAITACTDAPDAERVLQDEGYSNIKIGGYDPWLCDTGKHGSDVYATKFTATGPTGRPVSGVVCKGWLKGSTVRMD